VGEVSSTEAGGSKAAWTANMFETVPSLFPKIRALIWYEGNDPGPGGHDDWRIESSRTATDAFRSGIQSPTFEANGFARLTASPVPLPG
jgi:mannan endo-1,4-beta-mannosidase